MDEPDSNLDAEGTMALARAVQAHKRRGGAAVVVAHRHGAFAQCDTVYVMEGGRPVAATSGGRKAPVRKLQPGAAARHGDAPSASAPARKPRVASLPAKEPAPAPAREPQVASLPAKESAAAPGREEQILAAIARVTGSRPAPVTDDDRDEIAKVTPIAGDRAP